MAKLCKECHSAVEDKDILCPNCGAVLLETSGNKNELDSSVNNLLDSILEGRPAAIPPQQAQQPVPTAPVPVAAPANPPVQDASVPDDTDAVVMLGALETPETDEQPQFSNPGMASEAPAPSKNRNALESSFDAPPRSAHGSKTSKVLIVVVVLAILALFAAIVMLIVLPMQQQKQEQAEIVGYLEGAWISDEFAFTDSTAKNYVEVLTVDKDGNFKMMYTVPDEAYPDGWNTGMWKIEKEISGHIDYIAEEQRLLLLYEEDGGNYFFDRTFIVKEDDTMCLREYYDESKTSFYDVNLYRINMGNAQGA